MTSAAKWIRSANHLLWIILCWFILSLSLLELLRIKSLRNSWRGKDSWSVHFFSLSFLVRWKEHDGFASRWNLLFRRIWWCSFQRRFQLIIALNAKYLRPWIHFGTWSSLLQVLLIISNLANRSLFAHSYLLINSIIKVH